MIRRSIGAALVLAVTCTSVRATAAGNEAAAEALFVEAKKLATQGKYAEACPKFAESNRLDRGAGTLIHLGDCYEKNKQSASAWATYKEAASAAQALGRKDWEKLANQRAQALEPKLARLTIKVEKTPDGLDVKRDGTSVSAASFGVAIPVDVGAHTIEASAPAHKPFKTTVTVAKDGASLDVAVPALEPLPAAPVAQTPATAPAPVATTKPAEPERQGSSQATVGWVVGGIGVAGLAAGAVTGLMAMGKSDEAKSKCPDDGKCASRDAVDASESAKTFGLVSTIAFAAGGVALAAGAALVFTAPKEGAVEAGSTRLRLAPSIGASGAGFDVAGVF